MGLIFRYGRYYVDYYSPNGERKRECVGANKKVAETVLAKRRVAISEGKYLDVVKKEKIKFNVFAQEYLNVHSKQHKKTWKTDSFHIKDLGEFFNGKFLYEITAQDVERFKMERSKQKIGTSEKTISPATINRQLGTLRGLLNKAVAWGKLQSSPMKSVQFLKEPAGRLRFLETEEIVKLLSNCSPSLRPIVVLAVFTGMRRGEILGLKWNNIDYKRGIITLLDTKNGQKREVPMSDTVKNAIIQVRKHPGSPYVFCNEHGQGRHDIRKSYATALKKSAIIGFRFHDLRHTFASQLVMSGIDLNTVRELLGHKDITMTLRYSHLAPRHRQHAVDILSKKLDPFWTLSPKSDIVEKQDVLQVVDNSLVTAYGE